VKSFRRKTKTSEQAGATDRIVRAEVREGWFWFADLLFDVIFRAVVWFPFRFPNFGRIYSVERKCCLIVHGLASTNTVFI
jgi:hypothetical protein